MPLLPELLPELLIVAGSAILVAAYHIYFWWQLKRRPDKTIIGRAKGWRHLWVERMVARQDNIIVVQTLRNWIMSSSFLASTALLIAAGLLGFLVSADKVSQMIHELNFLGLRTDQAFSVKVLALIGNFFLSFFNFSLAIRYYNYGVLRATGTSTDDQASIAEAVRFMNKGAMHYAVGMRCYYFAIPLALWLLGPLWLGIGALILTVSLYRHDHAR